MKLRALVKTICIALPCMIAALPSSHVQAAGGDAAATLAGTWTLVAADVLHGDGSRGHDYGPSPRGMLFIDADGRYSLQIFDSERRPFATGDKLKATEAEYRAAVLGVSSHFGKLDVDPVKGTLDFHISKASFPNWEGTEQVRLYELKANELSYRVPPRSNGDTPISVWRRVD
ncbi:lipocalin-like domain protein [Bradyrhizobium sp. LTSPM299]|nr:lipocalin-like domain protein [Bradyrhizobium sp. LTSPM299]